MRDDIDVAAFRRHAPRHMGGGRPAPTAMTSLGLMNLTVAAAMRLAFGDHQPVPLGQRGLGAEGPHRAAIGAVDKAALLQLVEIAPDRFGRNLEIGGQIAYPQARRRHHFGQDALVALLLAKATPRRS